jgi:hypothetical protein
VNQERLEPAWGHVPEQPTETHQIACVEDQVAGYQAETDVGPGFRVEQSFPGWRICEISQMFV